MEASIGYEALFSAREWNAIQTGDWSELDDEDPEFPPLDGKFSSGVATTSCPGSAAQRREVAPEDPSSYAPRHAVEIAELAATEDQQPFQLVCSICDEIGAADTSEEAQAIARLHQAFVATLIDTWEVPS